MKKLFIALLTVISLCLTAQNSNKSYENVTALTRDDSLLGSKISMVVYGTIIKSGIYISKDLKDEYYETILKVKGIYKNSQNCFKDTISIITWKDHYTPKKKLKKGEEEMPTKVFDAAEPPRLGLTGVFLLYPSKHVGHYHRWGQQDEFVARKYGKNLFLFNQQTFKKESQMYQYLDKLDGVVIPDSLTNTLISEARIAKEESISESMRINKIKANNKLVADSLRDNPRRNKEFSQKYPLPNNWHSMNENEKTNYRLKFTRSMDSTYKEKHKEFKKKVQNESSRKSTSNASTISLDIKLSNYFYNIGSNFKALEFDIELKASQNTYLDNCYIYLKYNPNVFGGSASNNATIDFIFPNISNYDYVNPEGTKRDQSSNTLNFNMFVNFLLENPRRLPLSTSFQKYLHVSFLIESCKELPETELIVDSLFTASYTTTPAPSPFGLVNELKPVRSFSDIFSDYCLPSITTISPQTITAGTSSILTINGKNFGSTKGELKFVDANDRSNAKEPVKGMNASELTWSDTQIQYVVHAASLPINTVVGSGNFRLLTSNNDSTDLQSDLNQELKVPYAISSTVRPSNGKSYPLFHANNFNADGRISFYIDVNGMPSQAIPVIIKAIKDLRCYTGINFLYVDEPKAIEYGKVRNDYSTISFETLSSPTLGATQQYIISSCNGTNEVVFIVPEVDIRLDKSTNWSYDTTGASIRTDEYSLYEVFLHELTHAAGLDHMVSSYLLMKSTATKGVSASDRYSLYKYSDETVKSAVDWLFKENSKNIYGLYSCNQYYPMQRYGGTCNAVYLADEQFYASVQILNNPTIDGKTAVRFQLTKPEAVNLRLVDMMGSELMSFTKSYAASEIFEEIDLASFAPGLYGLVIQKGNDLQMFRIVKQ